MAHPETLPPASSDPVLRSLENAPLDDEPETADEAAAVERAREQARRGEVLTTAELLRQLRA